MIKGENSVRDISHTSQLIDCRVGLRARTSETTGFSPEENTAFAMTKTKDSQ